MHLLFFVVVASALVACDTNTSTKKPNDDSASVQSPGSKNFSDSITGKVPMDLSGCYWKVLKRDTFALQLTQNGNDITGKLSFDNYEKDASSGFVRGTADGDIMKLWYNFASEGMNSVMEIYFKKDGERLLRGTGPVDVSGDTSYYTDHASIQYLENQSFEKLVCEELPAKYK